MKKRALVLTLLLGEAILFLAFVAWSQGEAVFSPATIAGLFALELWSALVALVLAREPARQVPEAPPEAPPASTPLAEIEPKQIAHDLKSPLAALRTALIMEQTLSPDGKELLELAIQRIKALADRLET